MILMYTNRALAAGGTILVVAQMLLICADIVMRSGFSRPIAGVPELVELSIVALVFLQIPNSVASNSLIRSDGLLQLLEVRKPKVASVLNVFFSLAGAAVMAVIAYGMWFKVLDALKRDLFIGNPGIFTAPVWPTLLCIVLGAALGCINFLNRLRSADSGQIAPQGELK